MREQIEFTRYVWVIVCPGYGDHDGMPEELWMTRAKARARLRELNDQWSHITKPRRVVPYRLRRMALKA